jgi:hypothetical protein
VSSPDLAVAHQFIEEEVFGNRWPSEHSKFQISHVRGAFSFKSLRATGTLAAVISRLLNGNGIMFGRGILHFDVVVSASGVEWWILIVGS